MRAILADGTALACRYVHPASRTNVPRWVVDLPDGGRLAIHLMGLDEPEVLVRREVDLLEGLAFERLTDRPLHSLEVYGATIVLDAPARASA